MGQDSKIEWTDHTFNPWWGCTHVHEGCRHCYAETWAKRFGVTWGPSGVRRVASEAQWREPLRWNKRAEKAGVRAKVFCASMADVFEDWQGPMIDAMDVEIVVCHGCNKMTASNMDCQGSAEKCGRVPRPATMDDVRRRLFALIDQTPWLDWQLVTKRPENICRMWPNRWVSPSGSSVLEERNRENVWLLTSISDQESANKQIPELLKCRGLSPVLGMSCEPLLGPICDVVSIDEPSVDWVIVGGESGPGARPMHPDWARSLRDQCQAANVPFFFKQWGEWSPLHGTGKPHGDEEDEGFHPWTWISTDGTLRKSGSRPDAVMQRTGKKGAGRILDGRTWDECPKGETAC